MKKITLIFAVLFFSNCLFVIGKTTFERKPNKSEITITIHGIESEGGSVQLAVFDSRENFMHWDKTVILASRKSQTPEVSFIFEGYYAPGEYSFIAYQDVNGNQQLDKLSSGLPREPFGMSARDGIPKKMDWEATNVPITKINENIKIKLYTMEKLLKE